MTFGHHGRHHHGGHHHGRHHQHGVTEEFRDEYRPGLFGSEEVREHVKRDGFGNTVVEKEVIDRDMFGRVTDVQEETVVRHQNHHNRHNHHNRGHHGYGGVTEVIRDEYRPGLFGSEEVRTDVKKDGFGNTVVEKEVIDRDMFGRVTDVREETVVRHQNHHNRHNHHNRGHHGHGGVTEVIRDEYRPGLFGSEEVRTDVKRDGFGNTVVEKEVIDRDMFGRVTDIREETVVRHQNHNRGHHGSGGVTEVIREEYRPGLFGSEEVRTDVKRDGFGNTVVEKEVIDRDMFGRVTDVREEISVHHQNHHNRHHHHHNHHHHRF